MNGIFEHYLAGESVYTRIMIPVSEKHRVTLTELTVIMFLANNPPLDTASDIVKCRGLAKSHVSVSVRELERRGYLVREHRNGNRRSVHLRLTEAVGEIVRDGRMAQKRFEEILFEGITEEEKLLLTEILKKTDRNIQAYAERGDGSNAKK